MLVALGPLEAKWPEDVQEGMLLVWKKKESKTVRKSKIIDSRSSDLPSLGMIGLDWLMKSDK